LPDPDSDPEQDLFGMISNGVDHPGFAATDVSQARIGGCRGTRFFSPLKARVRPSAEVAESCMKRFGPRETRIALVEGYHAASILTGESGSRAGLSRPFSITCPVRHGLPPVKELTDKALQCTRTGAGSARFQRRKVFDGG